MTSVQLQVVLSGFSVSLFCTVYHLILNCHVCITKVHDVNK